MNEYIIQTRIYNKENTNDRTMKTYLKLLADEKGRKQKLKMSDWLLITDFKTYTFQRGRTRIPICCIGLAPSAAAASSDLGSNTIPICPRPTGLRLRNGGRSQQNYLQDASQFVRWLLLAVQCASFCYE